MRRPSLIIALVLVILGLQPAQTADGTIAALFDRVTGAADTSLARLQTISVDLGFFGALFTLKQTVEIKCDYECAFPGFCLKYVTRQTRLDLTPYQTNHTTYTKQVRDGVSGEMPGLRAMTDDLTRRLAVLGDASGALSAADDEEASGAEARFRQALGDAATSALGLRDQALRAAQSLTNATNRLEGSAEFSRKDLDRWIGQTKGTIKADDRCYQGEEQQVELLRVPATLVIAKIAEIVSPTVTSGRAADTALRALSGAADMTYQRLTSTAEGLEPGFAEALWQRIAAANQANAVARESRAANFFALSCPTLDWCRPL